MRNLKRVAILSYEGMSAFEFACALEIFALPRPDWKTASYQTEALAIDSKTVSSTGGVTIGVARDINALEQFGTLIVPSWPRQGRGIPAALAHNIQALYAEGGRLLSICSGAFLLAELGLLDGRRATTHWLYGEDFAQRFPKVDYQGDVLYTEDDNIFTSAGSSAGLDLGLHIVRQDFGHQIANQVARRLVMPPHRAGGQAQFIEQAVPKRQTEAGRLSETLDWAIKNLDKTLSVNDLAAKTCLSRRSFDRQFRAALNMSAKQWLISQRVARAAALLESSRIGISQIAEQSGFETAMNLRHHFKRHKKIAPSQYRAQFGQA